MSTALAQVEWNDEYLNLIRRTVCNGATNDEFMLFIQQCKRTGLDALSRQIHAVKRGGKLTIQIGIDGLRLIAARTGEADGQDGPYFCGEDGAWKDVWFGRTPPAAAKVAVYRKGHSRPYVGVATWAEFNQGQGLWGKMPTVMLAKVAESIALRKAFPAELSGLYAPEEIGDAPAAAEPHDEHITTAEVKQLPPATKPDPKADYERAATDLKAAGAKSCSDLQTAWARVYKAGPAVFGENLFGALELLKDELKAKCQQAKPASADGPFEIEFGNRVGMALSIADLDELKDEIEGAEHLTDSEYKRAVDLLAAAYKKMPAGK